MDIKYIKELTKTLKNDAENINAQLDFNKKADVSNEKAKALLKNCISSTMITVNEIKRIIKEG